MKTQPDWNRWFHRVWADREARRRLIEMFAAGRRETRKDHMTEVWDDIKNATDEDGTDRITLEDLLHHHERLNGEAQGTSYVMSNLHDHEELGGYTQANYDHHAARLKLYERAIDGIEAMLELDHGLVREVTDGDGWASWTGRWVKKETK